MKHFKGDNPHEDKIIASATRNLGKYKMLPSLWTKKWIHDFQNMDNYTACSVSDSKCCSSPVFCL